MKKISTIYVALIAAALFTVNTVSAQTNQVTLNVVLKPLQTIMINDINQGEVIKNKEVNLIYDSKEKYQDGVSVTANDQISIYSTGGFNVKVKSAEAHLKRNADGNTGMLANTIKITASKGTSGIDNSTFAATTLSNQEQVLIANDNGSIGAKFNIEYKGAGGNDYLNLYKKAAGEQQNVFTTTLTYTIEAK